MICGDICRRAVVVARKDDGIREIAELMREHDVGTVIVIEGEGSQRKPIGIMTDRDIVLRVITKDIYPNSVTVGDIMCCDLVHVNQNDDLSEAIQVMKERKVRRVPVVDDHGYLKGIMSSSDAMKHLANEIMSMSMLHVLPSGEEVCCH